MAKAPIISNQMSPRLVKPSVLSDSLRDALHYTEVPEHRLSLAWFPDFFLAGPQRTGTTWIFHQLATHKHIHWFKGKEVHFFSLLDHENREGLAFRSKNLADYLKRFEVNRSKSIVGRARRVADRTALRLRRAASGLPVIGEATASYAAMGAHLKKEAATLNPCLKVIIMLRDPVDRAWSHAVKDLIKEPKVDPETVSDEAFISFFRSPYVVRCANYVDNIKEWRDLLPDGHVLLLSYHNIARDPQGVLDRVCDFLSVPRIMLSQEELGQVVNPTSFMRSCPPRLETFLRSFYEREIAEADVLLRSVC